MPTIYSKMQSASILLTINKSKKKSSSASTNTPPLMTFPPFFKDSIAPKMEEVEKVKPLQSPGKIKAMVLQEPPKRELILKSNNNFMRRPKRSYKN